MPKPPHIEGPHRVSAHRQATQSATPAEAGYSSYPPDVPGTNRPYNLWITRQYRNIGGTPQQRLLALGPAARDLRDTILAIYRNSKFPEDEIEEMFEEVK
jgi:hypothetical protein